LAPWRLFLWETRMSTAWLAVRLGCSRRAVEDDRLALAERALVGCPVHGCGASLRCENDGWFGRAKSSTRGSSTHLANPDPTVRSQREEIGPESIPIESSIRLCSHSPGSVSRRRCDAEQGLESQSPGNLFLLFSLFRQQLTTHGIRIGRPAASQPSSNGVREGETLRGEQLG